MNRFNSSYVGLRTDLLRFSPPKVDKVLDVGCATGVNGKYLKDKGKANFICGIEFDEAMAEVAKKNNALVYCGDLNDKEFINTIKSDDHQYDVMLFGDILEHLLNPEYVLQQLTTKLQKGGIAIISLPNIAHIELFIQIYLHKSWPKNDRGIFDKTHLRWFTKSDAIALMQDSGLQNIKYHPKYRSRDALGSEFNFFTSAMKLVKPSLVTFQHVLVGTKG